MKQQDRNSEIQAIKKWLAAGSINIFGMPFAGKDTHAEELAIQLGAKIFGGGDILRNSIIPAHVQELLDAGELVPSEDYISIVLPYFSRKEFANQPIILSSVGRWDGEQYGVVEAAKRSGHEIKAVLFLKIDEATARSRWEHSQEHMTRGERADDDHHKLDVRFEEFKNKTTAVIEFYRNQGLLIEIDGIPDVARVSQNILDALYERAMN